MEQLLGIEIGGTKLQIVTGDGSARVCERFRFEVDQRRGGDGIREQIKKQIGALRRNKFSPRAVGVGFGGPVDWRQGQICCSHQIEGWSDFPLGTWLQEICGAPVTIDNDANVGALGEAICGAGMKRNPVFFITLGSGVGGGLVVDGKIYHGARPGESEIGQLRLDKSGATVESRCAGWAVDAKVRAAAKENPWSPLGRLTADADRGEAKALGPALQQGCAIARRILDETAEDLAFGLSHVTHLFHPEIVLLGGGLSLLGEPLRAAVENFLPKFTMAAFGSGPEIRLAALGEDAIPVGALELAKSTPTH